jgi:hypothetical protein
MVRRIVAVVAVASVLSGCAHVHRIDPVASGSELDELNRALQRKRVSVELVSSVPHRLGGKLFAESVHVAADSTSLTLLREPGDVEALWSRPSYGVKRDTTLSTSAISRMTITNIFRGALDGALIGLGIGGTGGAVWGAATGESPDLGPPSASKGAAFNGVVFGMLGLVVGLVCGVVVGSKDVYDFTEEPGELSQRDTRR